MKEQKIGCTVYDCKHCNDKDQSCRLKQIQVCHCHDGEKKEATMCDSYEKTKF